MNFHSCEKQIFKSFVYTTLCEEYPYLGLYWSAFPRIWTDFGEILLFSCIQFECQKIQTRITPNIDTFYAVLQFAMTQNQPKIAETK